MTGPDILSPRLLFVSPFARKQTMYNGLFPYHDAHHPECLKANRWLQLIQPNVISVWNGALKVFEVFDTQHGIDNAALILRLESDQGRGLTLESARQLIGKQLREMLRPARETVADIASHNQRIKEKRWEEIQARNEEDARYIHAAFVAEQDGASRWKPDDVLQSLVRAHGPA